jgi:hypothetical protein
MRRKKKAPLPWGYIVPTGLLAVVLAYAFFSPASPLQTHTASAQAGVGTNYAWSENIGWISFDCANQNVCGTSDYKVSQSSGGALSGYAWSENIGWISFNAAHVSGCPIGSCAPTVDLANGRVSGWARACGSFDISTCSGSQSRAGGWQGWIHLGGTAASGAQYGITQASDSCAWTGWGWGGGNNSGDAVVGWVHFNGTGYQMRVIDAGSGCGDAPQSTVVTLTATPAPGFADATNPNQIAYPGASSDVVLTLTTANVANCTEIKGGNPDQSITVPNTSINQSNVQFRGTARNTNPTNPNGSVDLLQTSFHVTCTPQDGSADITGTASITVRGLGATSNACTIENFSANPTKVKKGNSSELSWQTDACSACVITNAPAGSPTTFPYTVPSGDVGEGSKDTDVITVPTTFTLSCNGGTAVSRVTIGIEPVIIEI